MNNVIPFPRKPADPDSLSTLASATERLFLSIHGDTDLAAHMGVWARNQWVKYQALHPKDVPVPFGLEQAAAGLLDNVAQQYENLFHEMWLDQLQIEAQRFALEHGVRPLTSR